MIDAPMESIMTFRPKMALVCIALAGAVPATALAPDPHAGHHPEGTAPPPPAADSSKAMPHCAMMSGKDAPGQMMPGKADPQAAAMGAMKPGQMMAGQTMTGDMMAGCMTPPAKPADAIPPK